AQADCQDSGAGAAAGNDRLLLGAGLVRMAGVTAAGDVVATVVGAPRRAGDEAGVVQPAPRAAGVVVALVRARASEGLGAAQLELERFPVVVMKPRVAGEPAEALASGVVGPVLALSLVT